MSSYLHLVTQYYPLQMKDGRDVRSGHLRGWALEYADIQKQLIEPDPHWIKASGLARKRGTLMSEVKMANLFLIIKYALRGVEPLNIIEFGSYRGGGAVFFSALLEVLGRPGTVHALDTFGGMPATNPDMDLHGEGDFNDCDLPGLRKFLAAEGLAHRVELHQGLFVETLPGIEAAGTKFGLMHCDCDIYEGVLYSCERHVKFMLPEGFLVFDDPLHGSCLGAFAAIEEVLISNMGLRAEQVFPQLVYRSKAFVYPETSEAREALVVSSTSEASASFAGVETAETLETLKVARPVSVSALAPLIGGTAADDTSAVIYLNP